jgi:hypothetical protein
MPLYIPPWWWPCTCMTNMSDKWLFVTDSAVCCIKYCLISVDYVNPNSVMADPMRNLIKRSLWYKNANDVQSGSTCPLYIHFLYFPVTRRQKLVCFFLPTNRYVRSIICTHTVYSPLLRITDKKKLKCTGWPECLCYPCRNVNNVCSRFPM